MRRFFWFAPVLGGVILSAILLTQHANSAPDNPAKTDLKPVTTLPIARVILFSSGVAHFSRSGEIEGDVRVDLAFPEQDINDLIKSMVLQDFSEKGRVSAVTYDSREPIDRTLKSFAIDLSGNPSFLQILHQASGEQVEVVMQQTAAPALGTMTGKIMGIEVKHITVKDTPQEIEMLNLWCQEGMRNLKLNEIQRLRFTNPVLENEIRRALETLAQSHDAQKKAVSLHFSGEGKRKVEVGYVIENPIWKTTNRLVLDQKNKPYLQGWAVVENPTSEDWNGVEMALISGRPISFKMDLYNPLYINRPTVEPELFASLRPPTYSGALTRDLLAAKTKEAQVAALVNVYNRLMKEHKFEEAKKIAMEANALAPDNPLTTAMLEMLGHGRRKQPVEQGHKYNEQFNFEAIQDVLELGKSQNQQTSTLTELSNDEKSATRRTAQAQMDRNFGIRVGKELGKRMDVGQAIDNVASASQLGDYFQYVIDQPVHLSRQKSALLPIVNKDVEAQRVSIYNPSIQARHPLLGLKFKNTSGMHPSQGPITVFEGSTYAGDTRVLDMQPGEERLVSYAIDQGTEVSLKNGNFTSRITKVKANKGIITTETLCREETVYDITNRSTTDRTLILEHPNRKGQGFAFVGDNKPAEETADVFRFQVSIASKKDLSFTVREERTVGTQVSLTNTWIIPFPSGNPAPSNNASTKPFPISANPAPSNNSDEQIRFFMSLHEVSLELKAKLQAALKMNGVLDSTRQEIATVQERIKTITKDQDRLRQNLREFPTDSEIFDIYLAKLTRQEKEMNELDTKLASLQKKEAKDRAAYEDFVGNLSD